MLAADAKPNVLPRLARSPAAYRDKLADALLINRHEGVGRQNALGPVGAEECARVVAGNAQRRLRQVVGAKGENSAVRAMSPARSAARGSSIIVPR